MNEINTMNDGDAKLHRSRLQRIAQKVMLERGLLPDFSDKAAKELSKIIEKKPMFDQADHDLRNLLWCSIDNDDSEDLDQLTVAAELPNGAVKVFVAVADVDSVVKKGSAIDEHAKHNTTSVYTAAQIFPMLPEELSTDITSLNFAAERAAVVVEISIAADGTITGSEIYKALVQNKAKLAYNSVAGWLEGNGPMPEAISAVNGLAENIQLQNKIAQKLKALRQLHGALGFETIEARPVFEKEEIKDLEVEERNCAKDIIEDFMIAANTATARFLSANNFPALRRVVRKPKRWERIVELALEHNFVLPEKADSKALDKFLTAMKAEDPQRFPDLSVSIIKLLGPGEYVVELPGQKSIGHFGLAVKDYAHSTAPNRRYPDLITQRLLKAAIVGKSSPYGKNELEALAKHCTEAEDAAKKVERQVEKSAAAILLEARIGEEFEAFITGAGEKGTWVRLLELPVEGMLVERLEDVDVGRKLRVQLIEVNVERGYIDFRQA